MPPKLIAVYSYAKSTFAPILGYGGYLTFLQAIDINEKSIYAIIGAIIMAILSYFAVKANAAARVQVVGIESKVKEIGVTESADLNKMNIALELFDRGMNEAKEAREHFTEATKDQRAAFLAELKEARDHYEKKENELRQTYHSRLEDANNIVARYITRCTKIETQLKTMGIDITEECEVVFPANFERRKDK